ncbi:MAG TPA: hypothetical protein VMB19_16215 [Silvibacterium sp.]|nr:hypothetical protein [Silvibacterium sp.]
MTSVAIVWLIMLYLGSRWLASSAENVRLRARIVALKRHSHCGQADASVSTLAADVIPVMSARQHRDYVSFNVTDAHATPVLTFR